MSDIITNANRYNTGNTFRSDSTGSTRGNVRNSTGTAIGFDCSGLVYHVLRESGYNVPYATSAVMTNPATFDGSWATVVNPEAATVKPGTLVYFSGHVGIVQSYDPVTKTGEFLSMAGGNNIGKLKPTEPFTTDEKVNPGIHWGGSTTFKGFAEVKPELYDRTLDQHLNGANPNAPVFNIPEAGNAGFITLPGNSGFPIVKGAVDLSARVDVAAANSGITPPLPIDLPNANTAFATTLAALESNGQPNNGYGGWAQDGQGIGAIGRYGFRATSLKAIGWMDANGNWTDKARANGASSPESFRDSPAAQEAARVEYMGKLKSELKANGSWETIGQTVEGHVITEAGLIAAAWKEGAGSVSKFFSGDSTNANADTNIMFRFDRFAQSSLPGEIGARDGSTTSSGVPLLAQQTGGHWEDRTAYDLMAGLPVGPENKVWISDPTNASTVAAPVTPTPSSIVTNASSPIGNRDVVRHEDGSITVAFVAKADSTNGTIKKGDIVTEVFDPGGKLGYYSVSHTERGETTVMERIPNPADGEAATTFSHWVGNTLQFQGQWDLAGNRGGDRYTVSGVTYARGTGPEGQTLWLDLNGLNTEERIQQSFDQETQRLFNSRPSADDAEITSFRRLNADELRALETGLNQAATAGLGTVYANAETHTGKAVITDGGDGTDEPLNVVDSLAPNLASYLAGSRSGGAYGAGQLAGLDVLPFNDTSSFLVNAEGDMVGEIHRLSNSWIQVKDIGGESIYLDPRAASGDPNAVVSAQQYQDAQERVQVSQAASAIGLMNSIIGLQHWDDMSDLQRTAAVTSIYNAVDKISGNALPGDLGTAASVLGLLNALDQGNVGGALISGISLADAIGGDMASKAIGSALGIDAANVVPGLSLLLALDSGDPVSILAAAANFIPVYGQIISVVITIFGSLFSDEPDIPMREGLAHAEWDGAGNIHVITDQDTEGGGATATGWMQNLVDGLQAQLANTRDQAGNSYALIPNLLPAIGYQYDPDGFNLANGAKGFVYLKWTDENGQPQTRYYDGEGSRGDGTSETLAGDFMQHAQGAIAPAWQVQTVLAHYQQGQEGIHLPAARAGLPQELADGVHQALQALTLSLPVEPALQNALIDIDGDGYLERSQWLAANQSALAIDVNGDGVIGAGELLNLSGSTLGSLNWLDANSDKLLDARDPAFAALRLWMDVNADASSEGETQTLTQAGIAAIDFSGGSPQIIKVDGSRVALTVQTLTGDILGVAYQAVTGGVLQLDEQADASAIATLHAVNTRIFDGDAAHTHGGDIDTDGTNDRQAVLVDAQDSRLSTKTARTLANRTGNPLGFIPLGAVTTLQAQREATAAMIRSANGSPFNTATGITPLIVLALGAGAVQWPTVVSAESLPIDRSLAGTAIEAALNGLDPNVPSASVSGNTPSGLGPTVPADPAHVDLSSLQLGRVISDVHLKNSEEGQLTGDIYASNQALAQEIRAQAAINSIASSAESNWTSSAAHTAGLIATVMGADVLLAHPEVKGELIAGTEDIGLRLTAETLLANDSTLNAASFLNGPMLSISAVGNPSHGQVALRINEAGGIEVVFIPEANYYGTASFSYTVTDQYGLSTVAIATLEMASVNDAPTARDDTAVGNEDNTLMFNVADLLANDFDVDTARDGDVLHVTRVGLAEHGQVFLQPDGTVRFIPDLNYNGPAQFSYWVGDRSDALIAAGQGLESQATMCLTVLPVNDLPVVAGESIASDEDVVLNINPALLLANDTDVDMATNRQVLSVSAVSSAQHGTVALLADGTIQFTPEQDYFGLASFVYVVNDGNGGQVQGTAMVNLASVNDVPVANNELLMGKRDATYTLSQAALLANDTDLETPSGLSIAAVQGMTHGSAVLNADGSVTFAPTPGYAGRGQFQYVVQDADGGQSVGTTEIDFSEINVNPLAVDDSFIGFEDVAFVIQRSQLLANDSDPDASGLANLTVDAVRNASHGTATLQADGSVRFQPSSNFFGTATFEYRSNDGEGGQTWATAYLNVQSVNDSPIIEDIWYGRPIYGTTVQNVYGVDESGAAVVTGQATVPVYSESQARSLLGSGLLIGSGGSTYLNGHLRPVGFDNQDATFTSGESGYLGDDPYRQNGGVVAFDPDGNSDQLGFGLSASAQHGHAWANLYTAANAPDSIDHTQGGSYWVSETGAWQYYSQRGDGYGGADPFSITVTDSGGAGTAVAINTVHVGSSAAGGGGGKKPVTLDLNGNGLQYVGLDDSKAYFDVNSDGWREHLAWVSTDDGLLVRDIGADRMIDRFDEISFTSYLASARTDLEGLTAFDSNGDALLSRLDARWREFGVWQDADGNGVSSLGEFHTLDEIGITQIGLTSDHQIRQLDGVTELGQSRFTWSDGRTGAVGDVAFAVDETARLPGTLAAMNASEAGRASTAAAIAQPNGDAISVALVEPFATSVVAVPLTPEHMALLMVQMINTVAGAQDIAPLISIEAIDGQDSHDALLAAQLQWEQAAQSQVVQLHGSAA
jgi:hypothetical protein